MSAKSQKQDGTIYAGTVAETLSLVKQAKWIDIYCIVGTDPILIETSKAMARKTLKNLPLDMECRSRLYIGTDGELSLTIG